MLINFLFVGLGIYLILLSRKRKKEYRSFGTLLAIGVVLILFPLIVYLTLFFAMAMGGPVPS